jgi:hypothetical protein
LSPPRKVFGAVLSILLIAIAFAANVPTVSAYHPRTGDSFNYSQSVTVNNGQGSYSGYTDQTQTSGTERVNSVSGSDVYAYYSYSYQYSSNQGSSTSSASSGNFVWSSSNYTYVSGTDNQVGYSKPTYVWFAMNSSLAVGETFYILNTQFSVLSKNYTIKLPTMNNTYVQAIETKGTGQYQRNDDYGLFNASYTWYAYFDPSTGYIVGYNYVEQDTGQYQMQPGSFTYTDTLYVTSTSYRLAYTTAPPANASADLSGLAPILIALAVFLVIIVLIVYAVIRRRRKETLPKHPYTPYTPPPTPSPTPWESRVDLGSKPPEQVVIREVAKVNCKYCGTLIPTTVDTCPYCGGPRQ